MKLKHWMFLNVAVAFAVFVTATFGQTPAVPQDTPPLVPAGDIPAPPAGKSEPKKAEPKKKAPEKKTTPAKSKTSDKDKADASPAKPKPLSSGPAVAMEKNVNLRGQAAINSEIVTHIRRGEVVDVLEEVTVKHPKTDEPGRWAKVALPAGSVVWVNALFIDPSTKAVRPKRLNVRSGPGENYSVLGRVDRGYVVKEVENKGEWIKIEAPTNSYAFVAAHLLSTDPALLGPALAKAHPPAPPVPPPPTETAIVAAPVQPPPAQPLVAPPPPPTLAPPPPVTPDPAVTPVVAPPPPPVDIAVAPVTPPPAPDEPPAKRVVTREGVVKGSASIQAPTYFVLRNIENNRTINYLHSPETNIVLRGFQLQRVLVTGEEILDERWPNTPVITVETIQAVP